MLPWATLSILFIGFYSRVLRATILDNTNEDYVRTAHAKGLSDNQVLRRHTLRNSMIPIISLWGLDMGQLLGGGAILTESVFNLRGVGQLAATAIANLDVITIMVIVILTAFAVVLLSAVVDVAVRGARPEDPARMSTESTAPLLTVDDLKVSFATEDGVVRAVDGVSFTVDPGEVVAIVGESGSGKSVTAMTLLGLTRGPNSMFEGTATFDGTELIGASNKQLQRIRGAGIAMVFQDPMSSLDPVYRVGDADRRADPRPREGLQGPGDGPCGRDDGAGRHPARQGAAALLSARVLRRHAPARDDRDGAVVLAQAAARRRADDRARRDDPGPDPR